VALQIRFNAERASMWADEGRFVDAIALVRPLIASARGGAAPRAEARLLGNLGTWLAHIGQGAEAVAHLERAVAVAEEHGLKLQEGTLLMNLAIAVYPDDPALARVLLDRSATRLQAAGGVRQLATVRSNLGSLMLRHNGDEAAAWSQLDSSVALAERSGDPHVHGLVLYTRCAEALKAGHLALAERDGERAEALLRASGDQVGVTRAQALRSRVEARAGRREQAEALLAEAEALAAGFEEVPRQVAEGLAEARAALAAGR
jgi:tetratricopeptide (TPR) repeat protein